MSMPTIVTNTLISPQRFRSHLNVDAHVNSNPMIVTNTPAADLILTNLAYCSHADLYGFAILGTKLYLASIADSFVLSRFMMIQFLGFVLNWELEFDLRCKERRKNIFGFDLRKEHRLGERDRRWGERKNQLKKWEEREKPNKKIINLCHILSVLWQICEVTVQCCIIYEIWNIWLMRFFGVWCAKYLAFDTFTTSSVDALM